MRATVLAGLIAALLGGFLGFAIGRRSATRNEVTDPTANPQLPAKAPQPEPPPSKEPSTAVAKTPQESGSTIDPASSKAPEKPMSAKDRLFSLLLPHLSEEKKHSALWSAVVGNAEMQRRVFELLMASDDRDFLEAGQDLLISIRDAELLKEVLAAFASETNPERRAMLAYALGGNAGSADTRPTIQSILTAGDNRSMEQVLKRLSVQGSGGSDHTEFVPQLRYLVLNGPTPEIRSGAARSLRGDRTEEGVQFLIDRMLNDKDPDVAYQAMVALPVTYSGGYGNEMVQYRNLLQVAFDENRSAKMRRWAADRALMGTYRFKDLATEEQKAALKVLAEKK